MRTVVVASLLATILVASPALAQKGVPIRDLPPFPDVETEAEQLRGVARAGAAGVEEDVVTGAAKREQSLGTVASAVTVIPGERLRRFGYRTLGEALQAVVGLYVVDDRSVERIGIRGVQLLGDANTRILVLVDGSPVNEPWAQSVDAGYALPVELDDVARIEVVRGPVSSVYGTNAFLGIINIVTLEADKAPRAYARSGGGSFGSFGGNAGFGYGSVDRQVRGTVSWVNRGGEQLAIEPQDSLPIVTDADGLDALNASLTVTIDRLFFHVRAYDRTREQPGAPYNSVANSTKNRNRDRQVLVEAGYNLPVGDQLSLAGRLYLDRYRFDSNLAAQDIVTDAMGDDRLEQFDFTAEGNSLWYGAELRGLYEVLPGGKLSVTAGVSAEKDNTDSKSTSVRAGMTPVPVVVEKDLDIEGVYIEGTSQPFPWIAGTAGVRYDVNSIFDDRLSARGALFLQKGKDVGLKLLFAQGFRNPSIFEAFFADDYRYSPNLGPGGTTSLRPEDTVAKEVVLWGRPMPALNLRASYWIWDLTDLIEKDSVRLPAPVNDNRLQYRNRGEAQTQGVELEALYRDTRGWIGFGSFTYAHVTFNVDEAPFNAPALLLSGGVSTPLLLGYLHLSTELSYVGARKSRVAFSADDPDDVPAWLGWNLVAYAPNVNGFDITIGLRNILGIRQKVPVQADYDREEPNLGGGVDSLPVYTVPGPAREVFARLGYRF